MKNQHIWISAVIVVVVGIAAFFGGMQYTKASTRAQFATMMGQGGNGQYGFRRFSGAGGNLANGMRPVRGEVVSVTNGTITVKMSDGSSKAVLVDSSTKYNQMTSASQSDITTGKTVMVIGTQNSDGSITAQNIELNPAQPMMVRSTPSAQQNSGY